MSLSSVNPVSALAVTTQGEEKRKALTSTNNCNMPRSSIFSLFIYSQCFPLEKPYVKNTYILASVQFLKLTMFIYCLLPYWRFILWFHLYLMSPACQAHCCSTATWEYRRHCLKYRYELDAISKVYPWAKDFRKGIASHSYGSGKKKMVSFEMSLEKGNCTSWTWWYKTLQVEGVPNMSRGKEGLGILRLWFLSKLVEIQCLRVMVRTKRWTGCCKQILISGPHIVNHAQLSKVQNTTIEEAQ